MLSLSGQNLDPGLAANSCAQVFLWALRALCNISWF